jgi:hypothetical protein
LTRKERREKKKYMESDIKVLMDTLGNESAVTSSVITKKKDNKVDEKVEAVEKKPTSQPK